MIEAATIRPAVAGDVAAMRRIAGRAYMVYVPRIGRKPAPMIADFAGHVARNEAFVLESGFGVNGYIVLFEKDGAQFVENVAVDPARHGHGIGRRLMAFAELEAEKHGLSLIRLYTNARMTENAGFYLGLGYEITGRVRESGFDRVYFEKKLG